MDYTGIRPSFVLAPMATLSHEGLRRTIEYFGGCDEYYTEMIQASSLVAGGKYEPYYIRTGPVPEKIVWQLTGGKTSSLCTAAEMLGGLGGLGLDVNMGCCAPEIYRQGAGIAWMLKDRSETAGMIRAVKDSAEKSARAAGKEPLRLSVKIRLGAEDFTRKSLLSFCNMLVDEGVSLITLHPRTQREKFRRTARWEYVHFLAEQLPVPVYGNGDICDASSACNVLYPNSAEKSNLRCAGIMIGRAAVKNPWVFSLLQSCCDKTYIDLLELGQRYMDDLEECQPEEFQKTRSQRFFHYFCGNITFAEYLRVKISNASDAETIRSLFCSYFKEMPQDRYISI